MDSELQNRYNKLERAAKKVAYFKSYAPHHIYCSPPYKKKSCHCGLADLRAALGEENG